MLAFVASAEYVPRNLFAADLSYSDRPNFHGVHQKLHFVHQQSNGISQSLALKPKNFKQKIQQKRFLEGFSSIAFFFQVLCVQCSSVGILQRPTAGSSGTMPKTPWILSKKTVFFFNQKIGSHTVFGTILNFLRNEWPECTILKCSENFLAEPHNKQKNNTNIYNDTISISPQLVDQPCWPLTGISENTKTMADKSEAYHHITPLVPSDWNPDQTFTPSE